MSWRLSLIGILLALATATPRAEGNQLQGRVRVLGRPEGWNAPTIVYAEPLDSRPPIRQGHFKMVQRNKAFMPRVLAVPAGSTVEFPNEDLIFHNVFSLSRPRPFDLGLYRAGQSKSEVFPEPAIYRIFCNIHPQMGAMILVVPTSFITETSTDGTYQLHLPRGHYRLIAWSERSQPSMAEIIVSDSSRMTAPELSLDESHYQESPHKNKFGQDYPKSAYDSLRGRGGR